MTWQYGYVILNINVCLCFVFVLFRASEDCSVLLLIEADWGYDECYLKCLLCAFCLTCLLL